jgi:uncharacterized protein YkwD
MMCLKKNSWRILITSLVFLSATLFCNYAHAETLSGGFSSFLNFINTKIIAQVKNDFCRQYILSISTGDWKAGEFRTNLGKQVCTSFSAPSSITKVAKDVVQTLNGNATVSKTETPVVNSVNTPVPDVYTPTSTVSGSGIDTNQIIYLTNQQRKINDSSLVNLQYNSTLATIASIRVQDMFSQQYFEHNSPTGDNASKEAAKNGYSYITIGENIALGNFGGTTGLITAWMDSPGHRANILNKNYTEIGTYASEGTYKGQDVWIAAQIFGKPLTGCKSPDASIRNKVNQYKVSADSLMTNIKNIDAELKIINQNDTQAYNAKVAERNTVAGLYNNLASEIKALVAEYNAQVSVYNACIKTI